MTGHLTTYRTGLGMLFGAAAFLLLTGGRVPLALPRPFGWTTVVRGLNLGATAAFEEIVWRGVVLGGLLILVGSWPALGLSTAGFALSHWSSLRGRCAIHAVTGAAFGAAFLVAGLLAAILGHALYNVLVDWAVATQRARLRGP
jgi:membrane protease YdiL (CAAX protease family)